MERLLDYFTPTNYDLNLNISRQDASLRGEVRITGHLHRQQVKLHAVGLDIKTVDCLDSTYKLQNYQYDGEVLTVNLASPDATENNDRELSSQETNSQDIDSHEATSQEMGHLGTEVTLAVTYETQLNHNMQGCYLSTYDYASKKQRLVATQFESHYAREAFPCVDEPAAKAEFDLTIIVDDMDAQDVVLANTPCLRQDNNTFTFQRTPRMSTYLLAWVIGPLQSITTTNTHGVEVTSYAALNQPRESLKFANETAARTLDYYDEKFGVPYPLPKLDQVALPDFEAGAMENWGLVTYRESCMLVDSNASVETKRYVATVVTHELSHQWFGNLVTMQWWDDLWLNESFASVIEFYAAAALYPELDVWQTFFTGDCLAALRRDCLPGVQAVQQAVHDPAEIATLFDSAIVYAKGARLILMLIRLMGEANFDHGTHDYFEKFKYQNTVGDDLWSSLQPYATFDVKDFMHAWITQPGYPALQFSSDGSIHQQRFLINGTTDDTQWPLPTVKDDMSGHYLLDLPAAAFTEKLSQFSSLSPEQKLRLLIDRMLLAKAGTVESASLLDLLPHFAGERSSSVWSILTTIISDLKLFCPPETQVARDYRAYLSRVYHDQLSQINLAMPEADIESIRVRDMLLSIAYYVEDDSILKALTNLYQTDFLQLDSELRIYIISAKMFYCEDETFRELLTAYQKATDPELKSDLLHCLALAKKDTNLDQLIALLEQPDIVRPQDHIFLYIYLLRNYRTRAKTLDWLISHWDYVKTLTGEKSIEDYPRYAAGVLRTTDEAQKFYAFFDQFSEDPVLKRTIALAHVEIDARLALIKTQSAKVADYLTTDRQQATEL